MKSKLSRQTVYMLSTSFVLLVFVFVFSFAVLLPEGKKYRIHKSELKEKSVELRAVSERYARADGKLKKLSSENAKILKAFNNTFDETLFEKQYGSFFTSIRVAKNEHASDEDEFRVYDVNATAKMGSPKSFYDFLDAVNSAPWVIAVNFPIEFKRDGDNINGSFSMKVYNAPKEHKSKKQELH